MQVGFGAADVGAAARQFGRHAHRHARRDGRNGGSGQQFVGQCARRLAHKQAERVDLGHQLLLKLGQLRQRVLVLHAGLFHFHVAGQSLGVALLVQVQHGSGHVAVFHDDTQLFLRVAQVHVIARDFGLA